MTERFRTSEIAINLNVKFLIADVIALSTLFTAYYVQTCKNCMDEKSTKIKSKLNKPSAMLDGLSR